MKIVLFANTDWYLFNFRNSLATALKDDGHEVVLMSPSGPYSSQLEKQGFRWIAAPMERRSLNPLREAFLVLWLWRIFIRENIDIVHNFTIKNAVYGSLAARLALVDARVNAVVGTGYIFINNGLKTRMIRFMANILLRLALGGNGIRLILQNPDDVRLFESLRVTDPENIRLIPSSGVDCNRFFPDSSPKLSKPYRVLLAARLLWDKGIKEYVDAAVELKKQKRDIEFLLAGIPDPGNPAAIKEEIVQKWCDDGLINWLGHVNDMPKLLRSVDAVVLPSYSEGLPKSLIEAGACGLPLVTTNIPGCREVVTDGVDGLLVPVHDSKALAIAIARLHDDPQFAKQLGLAARAKVLREFDERIVIKRTLKVYAELKT